MTSPHTRPSPCIIQSSQIGNMQMGIMASQQDSAAADLAITQQSEHQNSSGAAASSETPSSSKSEPTSPDTLFPPYQKSHPDAFVGIFRIHHSKAYIELPESEYELQQYEQSEKKPKRMTPNNYTFGGGSKRRGKKSWHSKGSNNRNRRHNNNNWKKKKYSKKQQNSSKKGENSKKSSNEAADQEALSAAAKSSSSTETKLISAVHPTSIDQVTPPTLPTSQPNSSCPAAAAASNAASLHTSILPTADTAASTPTTNSAAIPACAPPAVMSADALNVATKSSPPQIASPSNLVPPHTPSAAAAPPKSDPPKPKPAAKSAKTPPTSRNASPHKSPSKHRKSKRKKSPAKSSTKPKRKFLNFESLAEKFDLPSGIFLSDILVPTQKDRNRAMDGDIIEFVLAPKQEWLTKQCLIPFGDDEDDSSKQHEILNPQKPQEHIQLTASIVNIAVEKRQKQHVGYLQPIDSTSEDRYCYFIPLDSTYPKCMVPIQSVDHVLQQDAHRLPSSGETQDAVTSPATVDAAAAAAIPDPSQESKSETQSLLSYHSDPSRFSDILFVARLGKWDENNKYPAASMKQMLGPSSLETELEAIISQNMLNGFVNFPSKVIEEVEKKFSNWTISEKDMLKRVDYKDKVQPFSIDPAGSKDKDDTFSIKKLGDDLYEVGIHIADVAHFVGPFSCVETEARFRMSTTYMVDKTFPMLPPLLSDDLCSLWPGKDRFTISTFVKMNGRGDVVGDPEFVRTVTSSVCTLDYDQAQLIIDYVKLKKQLQNQEEVNTIEVLQDDSQQHVQHDPASAAAAAVPQHDIAAAADATIAVTSTSPLPVETHQNASVSPLQEKLDNLKQEIQLFNDFSFEDLVEQIGWLYNITKARRQRRSENGAVLFHNMSVHFSTENPNSPKVDSSPLSEANEMVEEMMLLCNMAAGEKLLSTLPEETILRYHKPPRQTALIRFNKFCSKFGLVLNSCSQHSLNQLLDSVSGDLRLLLHHEGKKMMQSANYACASDISGKMRHHYALNTPNYIHFTSPIRRYADLMAQRLLLYAIKVPKPPYKLMYSVTYIRDVVSRCNLMNQRVKRAQEQCRYVFLSHTNQTFTSIVHSVSRNIILLYIPSLDVVSEVKVKDLPNFVSKQYFKEENCLEIVCNSGGVHKSVSFRPLQKYDVRIIAAPHANVMEENAHVSFEHLW